MSVTVKICGLRTAQDALAASEAGADMIGLMFAPSRRQVDVRTAREIVDALRASRTGRDVAVVGVFVDEQPAAIAAIAAATGLDWIQMSGHEATETAANVALPVIKALRFDGDPSEAAWLMGPVGCDAPPLLVDAHVAGSYGGTGIVSDWPRAAELAARRPVLLAGGLTVDNVAAAITAVKPWGVDVSSGVETEGVKDHAKIAAFVQAAKATQ